MAGNNVFVDVAMSEVDSRFENIQLAIGEAQITALAGGMMSVSDELADIHNRIQLMRTAYRDARSLYDERQEHSPARPIRALDSD